VERKEKRGIRGNKSWKWRGRKEGKSWKMKEIMVRK
jgi:hypothetical protein